MRKKGIAFTLILCLATTFTLVGCGSKPYGSYDLSEYVKVGKYKGLEVKKIKISVSKEEVKERIKTKLEMAKDTKQVTKGKVKKNDKANIDYEGKINGKAFDGGTDQGYDLEIGSGAFIPGFEDQLIGKAIGSTSDINVTFPKDYQQPDLAGKKATFTVKINYVTVDKVPKYDVAWIKESSGLTSKADYEKSIKDEIKKEKEAQAKETQTGQLFEQVVNSSKVLKYPDKEVDVYVTLMETQTISGYKAQYEERAKQEGKKIEDVWKAEGFKSEEEWLDGAWQQQGFPSKKEWEKNNKKMAKEAVKYQLIVFYIADKEGIEYTKEDEQDFKDQIAKDGYDDKKVKELTGLSIADYVKYVWAYQNITPKIGDLIFESAKIVDKLSKDKKDKDTKETKDKGADDATSNDQPGGADV